MRSEHRIVDLNAYIENIQCEIKNTGEEYGYYVLKVEFQEHSRWEHIGLFQMMPRSLKMKELELDGT